MLTGIENRFEGLKEMVRKEEIKHKQQILSEENTMQRVDNTRPSEDWKIWHTNTDVIPMLASLSKERNISYIQSHCSFSQNSQVWVAVKASFSSHCEMP